MNKASRSWLMWLVSFVLSISFVFYVGVRDLHLVHGQTRTKVNWITQVGNTLILDVRSFGAKCDGSTDDTLAIQAAATKAVATLGNRTTVQMVNTCNISGSVVVPPSGTVNTSSSGNTVSWQTGVQFAGLSAGGGIVINSVSYTIATVTPTAITLTTSPGTQTGVSWNLGTGGTTSFLCAAESTCILQQTTANTPHFLVGSGHSNPGWAMSNIILVTTSSAWTSGNAIDIESGVGIYIDGATVYANSLIFNALHFHSCSTCEIRNSLFENTVGGMALVDGDSTEATVGVLFQNVGFHTSGGNGLTLGDYQQGVVVKDSDGFSQSGGYGISADPGATPHGVCCLHIGPSNEFEEFGVTGGGIFINNYIGSPAAAAAVEIVANHRIANDNSTRDAIHVGPNTGQIFIGGGNRIECANGGSCVNLAGASGTITGNFFYGATNSGSAANGVVASAATTSDNITANVFHDVLAGIFLTAGSTNNRVTGNSCGDSCTLITDNATDTGTWIVGNTPGPASPVSAPSPSATPWTFTNGHRIASLYLADSGGTFETFAGGNLVCPSGSTSCSIFLAPNQAVVTVYTGTITPTLVVQ